MPRASTKSLEIKNLSSTIEDKPILNRVSMVVPPGKIIALMGPNGSGKSTLAHVLMGHPHYRVTSGRAMLKGKNILKLPPHRRAQLGLFLAFQYPHEVPGVNMYEFLLTAYQARFKKQGGQKDFDQRLKKALAALKLSETFLERSLNDGFSGGEKKKAEILQLMLLQPSIAILDETDSGLDIDALKLIAKAVRRLVSPKLGFLVITHYQRLLHHLKPDQVLVMREGTIVASGGAALAKKLEQSGYTAL